MDGCEGSDNIYQIEVTLIDENGQTLVVPWTVEVENVYEVPALSLSAEPAVYHIGKAAIQDSNAQLQSDVVFDHDSLSGAKLIVSITENRDAKDLLKIVSQGTRAGQVSVKRGNVLFGGIVVGTVTRGTKTSPNLVITFNDAATQSAVSAVLRQVGFSTKDRKAPQPDRTMHMQIVDLFGFYSIQGTRQINVVGRS